MRELMNVKKGTVLFKDGDESSCMYVLVSEVSAQVGIYNNYGTPEQTLLTKKNVDEMFGEMGALTGEPRSATAVALTDVVLDKIDKEDMNEYLEQHPFMLLEIMKTASDTLRRLTKQYTAACITLDEYMQAKEAGKEISEELAARVRTYTK